VKRDLRYRLEWLLLLCARALARVLPARAFLALGALLGRTLGRLDKRHRAICLDNLATAFPGAKAEERERIAAGCYAFLGEYLFDLVRCGPSLPEARLRDFEFEGLEHALAAARRGKGVLFFTGHFGGWEFYALAYGGKGLPLSVLTRPLDNPRFEALLTGLRRSTGNEVLDKFEGVRRMLAALRRGRGLAILIDQNVSSKERVFVDFFGRPAATTPILGLLHLRTGAPLVPGFAIPLGGGRYRMRFGAAVEPELSGERDEDVRRITQACTRVIEDAIREHPELWLWMHRRFKTRPDDSPGHP
jgi:Kdo2-lipid IVA lauroyltransferase/acyltransferase